MRSGPRVPDVWPETFAQAAVDLPLYGFRSSPCIELIERYAVACVVVFGEPVKLVLDQACEWLAVRLRNVERGHCRLWRYALDYRLLDGLAELPPQPSPEFVWLGHGLFDGGEVLDRPQVSPFEDVDRNAHVGLLVDGHQGQEVILVIDIEEC